MTIEESFRETNDQFPVGMRVLAVDDDPICLRLLETLLRKCQYHVTTTSQAITALNLLRENKNKFDLVISDVHMPDMDGFKLLELVGLEMDLPVIMLSANGDTKLVMKGITHGACDYLLKPVRIEELKNIWQHVVRRKKFDPKDQNNFDMPQHEGGGQPPMVTGDGDQNGKLNRKRKDQNEDDDGNHVDNRLNNEDPSTQKKARVVWTVDLHRKFVAAVNQLGIDKAVPKRILELMNVEKLSRENVASHLQKYRLYLKRISCVASQQANLVAALGSVDSAYMRMNSLNEFENFPGMAGAAPFQGTSVRSIASSGMLGRLNSPAGLGMHGLSLFGMLQQGQAEKLSNPIENQTKCHSSMLSGNQSENILQGTPIALAFDHLQHKGVDHVLNPSGSTNDPVFTISSDFSERNRNDCSSSNSFFSVPYNSMMLQGLPQEIERTGTCGNQPCTVASSSIDDWPAIQPSEMQSNSFPKSEFLKQAAPSDFRNTISSMPLDVGSRSCGISSITSIPAGFPDLITDIHRQAGSGISCNSEKKMSHTPKLGWNDKGRLDLSHNPNLVYNSMKPVIPPRGNNNTDLYVMGEPNLIEETAMGTTVSLKPQNVYSTDNVGSLEDLVSAMMKPA